MPAFPLPAEQLIPQRPPMLLVHQLLSCTSSEGLAAAVIAPDNLFHLPDGTVHPAAFFELMAQSYAAVHGYQRQVAGQPPGIGFLGGIRRAIVHGAARVGDRLLVTVRRTAEFSAFVVAEARVERDGETLADGELILFIPPPAQGRP